MYCIPCNKATRALFSRFLHLGRFHFFHPRHVFGVMTGAEHEQMSTLRNS